MTTTTNRNNSEDDLRDLNKIDADITKHRKYAIRLIMTVFTLFIIYFVFKVFIDISLDSKGTWVGPQLSKLSTVESGNWGTFGDFIGGILNPIFALFAFYWLTYSVRLQIKELKDTRQELKKAATAQAETATHQEKIANLEEKNVDTQKEILELQKQTLEKQIKSSEAQQLQISIQNFENLFFELLKTKSDATNEITYRFETFNGQRDHTITGKNAIKQYLENYKKHKENENWETYYKDRLLDIFGSYFRICYQIVKLIDNNTTLKNLEKPEKKEYSIKQKEYFDLFRATLTQHELEAFFFNCLSSYGREKFKELIEKYGMLEPLPMVINKPHEQTIQLCSYAYQYNCTVFEENKNWERYFNDIRKINTSSNPNEVMQNAKYIESTGVHLGHNYLNEFGLLSFESIKQKIENKINLYEEKFNKDTIFSRLSSELQTQYNELNVLKKVNFSYEIYIILKYEIDFNNFIIYQNK